MRSRHAMPFGAAPDPAGGALFRLWAPSCARVELALAGADDAPYRAMHRVGGGWHELHAPDAAPGSRYRYRIDGDRLVPDPASRANPDGVHGPSELVDATAYAWQDGEWRGRPWHEAVVYELHVGTFTPQGTFAAAALRLHDLAQLGFTAIELMPLAGFPGRRNWGYDGVLLFAPDSSYGTPADLKALVDQAHALGLVMLLDVVYNHFGPEGNYLHGYCPEFFDTAQRTPWGAAIDFDGPCSAPVRDFYRHNALYWVEEYHFDGLRLDAVHAIHDTTPHHIVCEIGAALRQGPGRLREVHLVLENERNQAHLLARDAAGALQCATAQWNDDLHHAAHVLLSGETEGYYGDYADRPAHLLARALAEGYVYSGQPSAFRAGAAHGEPGAHLPASAFVSFLQNHDQIGNRAFGERIDRVADDRLLPAVYACLLLAPHVPMMFQGEEFAASSPFLYFCDFGAELAQAVSAGRRAEFGRFAAFAEAERRAAIPDPNAVRTFDASKLRWDERHLPPHRERLALVAGLLALRHRHLVPRLGALRPPGRFRIEGEGLIRVDWRFRDGASWTLEANLGKTPEPSHGPLPGETVYVTRIDAGPREHVFHPGAVRVTSGPAHA